MHGAVAVVVEGEVEPLFVGAHEAVGVVDAALRTIDAFFVQDALVGPSLQAVEADPKGQRAAVFRVGVVQHRDRVAAERIQRGFAAGVRDSRDAGEFGPGSAAVFGLGGEEYAAQAVGEHMHNKLRMMTR